jgi:hypothetical protein
MRGIPHYWLVDLRDSTLTVVRTRDGSTSRFSVPNAGGQSGPCSATTRPVDRRSRGHALLDIGEHGAAVANRSDGVSSS